MHLDYIIFTPRTVAVLPSHLHDRASLVAAPVTESLATHIMICNSLTNAAIFGTPCSDLLLGQQEILCLLLVQVFLR